MQITSPAEHPPVRETYINPREVPEFREDVSGLIESLNDRFDATLAQVIPPDSLQQAKNLIRYEALSAALTRNPLEVGEQQFAEAQRLANDAEQNRGALKAMGLQARGEQVELRWTSDQVPETVKRDLGCDAIGFELSRCGRKDFEVRAETKWVNSQPPINGSTSRSGLLYYGTARLEGPLTTLSEVVRDGSRAPVRYYTNVCNALDTDTRVRQRAHSDEDSYQHVAPRELAARFSEPTRDFHNAVTAAMGFPGWLTIDETGR